MQNLQDRHIGITHQIGQAILPLSFGLANNVSKSPICGPSTSLDGVKFSTDLTNTLTHRVLKMLIFSGDDMMAPHFQPSIIFYLVGKLLEDKVAMPSLDIAQTMVDNCIIEELEASTQLQAKLATEAIAIFNEGKSHQIGTSSSKSCSIIGGEAYLASIVDRSTQERFYMKLGVELLVNDNDILIIGGMESDTTCATPSRVMMDTWAQPVMLDKRLTQELNLTSLDLDPCPFTIITLVGGTKHVTNYTK